MPWIMNPDGVALTPLNTLLGNGPSSIGRSSAVGRAGLPVGLEATDANGLAVDDDVGSFDRDAAGFELGVSVDGMTDVSHAERAIASAATDATRERCALFEDAIETLLGIPDSHATS
jgi:hypothetical protein